MKFLFVVVGPVAEDGRKSENLHGESRHNNDFKLTSHTNLINLMGPDSQIWSRMFSPGASPKKSGVLFCHGVVRSRILVLPACLSVAS